MSIIVLTEEIVKVSEEKILINNTRSLPPLKKEKT